MPKISLDEITKELLPYNWKVLSTEYKNLETEMTFMCDEGHKVYNSWKSLRNNIECPVCKSNTYKNQDSRILKKQSDQIRILALDQATNISGWSIYENGKLLKYGTFSTNCREQAEKFYQIKSWLISMIQNWQPDWVGIEGIQFQSGFNGGVTTFEALARLQGV